MGFFDWLRNRTKTDGVGTAPATVPLVTKAYTFSDLSVWRTLQGHQVNTSRPYATHAWVHRAVRVKEQAAAGIPARLYSNPDDPKEIIKHPILDMLKHPNEQLSGRDLIQGIVNHLDLCGNALMVIVRGGSSGALVPLNPRMVEVMRTGNLVTGYRYFGGGGSRIFPVEQVLHIKYPSDEDPCWGVAPMEAAMRSYTDDITIRTHNAGILSNSGVPRGVLTSEQPMSVEQVTENKARWESTHVGADNAGKTAILTGGLKFESIGVTQQEFDFIQTRNMSRDEIFSIFGTPISKANAGITDEGNHRSLERMFWNDTMTSLLQGTIADSINAQMWKLEGRASFAIEPLFLAFDFSQVPELILQKQEMQRIDLQKVKDGVMTQNEFRAKWQEGDAVKWGDVWWRPFGLEPQVDATRMEPEPVETEEEDDKATVVPFTRAPDSTQRRESSSATVAYSHKASDAMQWLSFLAKMDTRELEAGMRDVMETWERRIVSNLAKAKGEFTYDKRETAPLRAAELDMLFDRLEAVVELTSIARKPLKKAQQDGGKRGLKLAGRRFLFQSADPNAVWVLRAQIQRFAEPVVETTWERIKESLLDGLNAGENESSLTDRIRDVMGNRRHEAQRIAATETAAAVNGGVSLGFMQSKVVKTKRWVTAGDEHVRESHKQADGQEVSTKQAFTVGGSPLQFPGDPSGPASEVINCRCTLVPGEIVEDEEVGGVENVS